MKKTIIMMAVAMLSLTTFAQSPAELARQQRELNNVNRKLLNEKPTKEAKRQAKELKKQGWKVPAGARSIEQQISESHYLGAELMADENGAPVRRYIIQESQQTGGSYNAAYAAARNNAQVELAAMLKTDIAAAMETKLDNQQSSLINATTVDKFHERAKAIVNQALSNSLPVVSIYRELTNNNIQVQVTIAFDKKELAARIKRNLQRQLEVEGDELNEIVDEVMKNKF